MLSTKKRVVILARVSTAKQETVNQLLQLREFCLNNNFEIVQEITENVSGNTADRKGIQLVISLASQKKFDLLLFWNLDRFSRLGISQTLHYFELLEGFGIQIKSFTQPYLDTSNSVIRELLLAFFSYMANFQLKRYSEDIKAGQQRAIAAGKRIGRPHIPSDAIKVIRSLKNDNYSNRAIAAQLNINEKTVRNYLKSLKIM